MAQIPTGSRYPGASSLVQDTFAESHLNAILTLTEATNHAATTKTSKYVNIISIHIFTQIVIETAEPCNRVAIEIIKEKYHSLRTIHMISYTYFNE